MNPSLLKLQKKLTKRAEKNRVPYYHELAKFKSKLDKDYEKLRKKQEKLIADQQNYEILIEDYRKKNNSQHLV